MTQTPFQDLIGADNNCFGCGPNNPDGLRIKSRWNEADPNEAVCVWHGKPFHSAGPPEVMNGGIIATLLDCHSICTAFADAYRFEGREIGSDPLLWYVTASISIQYLRPTPLGSPVTVRASVVDRRERRTTVAATLESGGEACARAEVVAARLRQHWST